MAIYLYALEEFSAHLLETVTFGGPGLYCTDLLLLATSVLVFLINSSSLA